jgi:hypothetical protein
VPRLEQVDDEHSERVQDCRHRRSSCDDSELQCESQVGYDFREGQVHEGASCITPSRPFRFYPKAQIRRRADRASESPAASLSLYHFISHVVLCGMSIAV